MMVICIKKGQWRGNSGAGEPIAGPTYHEECLVLQEVVGQSGVLCYRIKDWDYELRPGVPRVWAASRFRPLPDISIFQKALTTTRPKVPEREDA